MNTYRIMVEARDHAGKFLTTLVVAANTLSRARECVQEYGRQRRWNIDAWEEEDEIQKPCETNVPGVLSVTGKAYFEAGN